MLQCLLTSSSNRVEPAADKSVYRQILLLNGRVKGGGRRALSVKRHTCLIRKQPKNRSPDLCRYAVSTSESNLLPLTLFFSLSLLKYQRADDPFPPPPLRPAAGGSESHFRSPPLKVPLQTRRTNRKQPSFMSLEVHAAHVNTREAGRCARVSCSGCRY